MELIEKAKKAMENAYAPYSGYQVGAALLCDDSSIFCGCNMENAAYSPTICAERAAFSSAISAGKREFTAIAICGGKGGKIAGVFPPCGVCRQVMKEFCSEDFKVYLITAEGYEETTLGALLPKSFTL